MPSQHQNNRAYYILALLFIPLAIGYIIKSLADLGLIDDQLAAVQAAAVALVPTALLLIIVATAASVLVYLTPDWLEERRQGMILGLTGRRWRPTWRLRDAEREAHWLVTGVSGMGKSRLLLALIVQIFWRSDENVVVIDPHGTLIHDVLGLIGKVITERASLIIEVGFGRYIYGLDPLRCGRGDDPARRAKAVAQAFASLYGHSWSDRIQGYLTGCFQALIEAGYTLAEAERFYNDTDFRLFVLDQGTSTATRNFARTLAKKFPRQLADETSSVLTKLHDLLASREMCNVVGLVVTNPGYVRHRQQHLPEYQPRVVDLLTLLARGHPVFVGLTRKSLGGFNVLLAGMIVAVIGDAVMARDDELATSPIRRVTLIADELQSYATDTVVDIIEQARKFRLSLCASCTTIHTLPDYIRTALLSTRLLVAFQVTTEDADLLARQLFRRVLARNGRREAQRDTSVSPGDREAWQTDQLRTTPPRSFWAFSRLRGGEAIQLEALNVEPDPDLALREAAREASGRRYGNDRDLVEAEFALREEWLDTKGYLAAPFAPPAPPTDRRPRRAAPPDANPFA